MADYEIRDTRDAEIERLRYDLGQSQNDVRLCSKEIERLRTALTGYQKRLSDDLDRGGKLVEQIRMALPESYKGTCTMASMAGVVGPVGRLCDEVERLREELDRVSGGWEARVEGRQKLVRLCDDLRAEAAQAVRQLITEQDEHLETKALLAEAREEWEHADARPDESALRELADQLHAIEDNGPCGIRKVTIDHVRTLINCVASTSAEYRAECVRLGAANTTVTAERDRLRQELDLVGERHAAGLLTLRQDFTAAVNGLLPKPAEPNRRGCPCKSQCDYLDAEDRCSDHCDCAAGRRWIAGDPEPEIGTTVRRTSVADYYQSWTRMSDGSWHPNHACRYEHDDQCSGLVFAEWEQLPRPLVEVVSTDGE